MAIQIYQEPIIDGKREQKLLTFTNLGLHSKIGFVPTMTHLNCADCDETAQHLDTPFAGFGSVHDTTRWPQNQSLPFQLPLVGNHPYLDFPGDLLYRYLEG